MKNQYRGGRLPKKGGLGMFADLRGDLARKRGGGVFEWGAETPMHTIVHCFDSQFLTPFFHFSFESSFHNHLFGLFEKLKICVHVFSCT